MKLTHKQLSLLFTITLLTGSLFAFEKGWVLNMRGNVGGSVTTPMISEADLNKLTANKMEGMTGFIGGGNAEVGYIFDNETYFNLKKDNVFSGLGLFGRIGVTQGYAGQISGASVPVPDKEPKQIDVFVNVFYTPVITFGAATKAYFFKNKLAVGLGVGAEMIADTAPTYEIYSTEPDTIGAEVGTIIVDEWMMKNMNPFTITTELFAEYNVKILDTTELILGGYMGYNIYTPKYVTMPDKIMNMLKENSKVINGKEFDTHEPLESYYINSLDFGLTFALGFKL